MYSARTLASSFSPQRFRKRSSTRSWNPPSSAAESAWCRGELKTDACATAEDGLTGLATRTLFGDDAVRDFFVLFFSGARVRTGGGLEELLLCLLGLAEEALESLASRSRTGALPVLSVALSAFVVTELAPVVLTAFGRLDLTDTFLADAVVPFCTLVRAAGALRTVFLPAPAPGAADAWSAATGLISGERREQGEALLSVASRTTLTAFSFNVADAVAVAFCPLVADGADRFESVAFFDSVLGLANLVFTIFVGAADNWRFTSSTALFAADVGGRLLPASVDALDATVEDV